MTAKEYLKQLWWIDQEINEKIKELDYLRERAGSCSAPEATGMPKGGGAKDKISEVIIKLVDLQTYIDAETDKLIDLRTKITKQICKLRDQRSRVILSCRYIRQMKWEDIEAELHYEKSTLMRVHRKALMDFEHAFPEIKKYRN